MISNKHSTQQINSASRVYGRNGQCQLWTIDSEEN